MRSIRPAVLNPLVVACVAACAFALVLAPVPASADPGSDAPDSGEELVMTDRETLDALADANRAAIADGTYAIRALCSEKGALDVAGSSVGEGANVCINDAAVLDSQRWVVSHDEAGYLERSLLLRGASATRAITLSSARVPAPGIRSGSRSPTQTAA